MTKLPRDVSAQELITILRHQGWRHSTTKGREATFIRGNDQNTIIMVTLVKEVSVGILNKAIKTKSMITGKTRDEIIKELKR
jgi:predicted RNA binding protein YcfA (HicA-like mRNA interferase family)